MVLAQAAARPAGMLVLVPVCSAYFLPFPSKRRDERSVHLLTVGEILLKSAVRDSVGDSDDLVYARCHSSLIMLLPEILMSTGIGIGTQILHACYCSGIFRAKHPVACGCMVS